MGSNYCADAESHLRRYFVRAGDANPEQLRRWSDAWLARIRALYDAHGELMAAWQEAAAPTAQGKQASGARHIRGGPTLGLVMMTVWLLR